MEFYYCFDLKDLKTAENNPFVIQAEYAKRSGVCLIIDSERGEITHDLDFSGKTVFLRCSCSQYKKDIALLQKRNAVVLENEDDICRIEAWYRNGICKRTIREVGLADLEDPVGLPLATNGNACFFVKSVTKDFSAVVSSERLFSGDEEWLGFVRRHASLSGERFLIADYVPILCDSVGTVEFRHFVMNGSIINSSRCIHSLHHTVSKRRTGFAENIVAEIKQNSLFPLNYVLDTAVFVDQQGNMIDDVVEINPITTAMCYINNSVFLQPIDAVLPTAETVSYGFEYVLDSMLHPQRYDIMRKPGVNYCYSPDCCVSFV